MIINILNIIPLFLNRIGGPQFIIILIIILLLFGGRKIPELMRGLGKGVRSFKDGLNEAQKELDAEQKESKDLDKKETDREEVKKN